MKQKTVWLNRAALALVLLFSGFLMLPFTDLSAQELNWQLFGGIYEPDLNIDLDRGAPGSAFFFYAANFPANTLATIYVEGVEVGTLMTDGNGQADFVIQSLPTDAEGDYDVTMSTDANTLDTDDYRIEISEPVLPPPANYTGPIFNSDGSPNIRWYQFLPFVEFQ